MKCAGLLEVTHFWQLIVPGRDKRQMRKEHIVRGSHHLRTKPLLFSIPTEKAVVIETL